jgi:hypothetical protein
MPNWVYNNIKIEDNVDTLSIIKNKIKSSDDEETTDFSFMKVIPRPIEEEDWYTWNINNWGTKWDACDAYLIENDNHLIYEFSTAWSPPEPIILALSKLFPTSLITHTYEEEQGWGGMVIFKNGNVNVNKTWDIPESHKELVDRGGNCGCTDNEKYFFDCFSYRVLKDTNISDRIKTTASILGQDWSGSYEDLIKASSKL